MLVVNLKVGSPNQKPHSVFTWKWVRFKTSNMLERSWWVKIVLPGFPELLLRSGTVSRPEPY